MYVFTDIVSLQTHLRIRKEDGKKIGLVPTMGALHPGHLSLIHRAKQECETVVCSIYVNPTQFNNKNDLAKYPRTLESDRLLLEEANCDVAFIPDDTIMYPQPVNLIFNFGYLETVMEGKYRKGHFNGVGVVVSKLFHIINPDIAYFGQKDLQQFSIIRQLVSDLSFNILLICCPIMREADGLAMSSRNARLNTTQRAIAPVLHQTLQHARSWLKSNKPVWQVKQAVEEQLTKYTTLTIRIF
jgi:pantoate--beta-alanine ligase